MKKIVLLITFLFAVVISQAMPPPDIGYTATDEVVFVADVDQTFVSCDVTNIDVQEVAYVYIGHPKMPSATIESFEPAVQVGMAEICITRYVETNMVETNKPPSDTSMKRAANNRTITLNNNRYQCHSYPLKCS